jgi:hypothetical protein
VFVYSVPERRCHGRRMARHPLSRGRSLPTNPALLPPTHAPGVACGY